MRYAVGPLRRRQEMAYDYLLLALGSETNYFGMTQVAARAATMKTLGDAALLRNRMVALLEDAATETDEAARRRLMTFVVAGGGFAGVETVGAMNDFLRDTLRYYPELDPSMLRVVLVHAGDVVLPELGERLGRYTQEKLEAARRGAAAGDAGQRVRRLGRKALGGRAHRREHAGLDRRRDARAGGRVAPGGEGEGTAEGERIPGTGGTRGGGVGGRRFCGGAGRARRPPSADRAARAAGGVAAAKNIEAAVNGTARKPFRFTTIGQLASIGHHAGVAQVLGMRFSGFAAWWLWRSVYLAKLPGVAKKVRVAIQWTLDLLFSRQIEQFLTLKDLEQIEQLAALVRTSRENANPPVHRPAHPAVHPAVCPTAAAAAQDRTAAETALAV